MANIKVANCGHELPCSCYEFEGEIFNGLESIIDFLVDELEEALLTATQLEGIEEENKELHDYINILEAKIDDHDWEENRWEESES